MRLSFMRWALLAASLGLVAAGDVSAEAPAYGYGDARSARPTFDLRRASAQDRDALVDDDEGDAADDVEDAEEVAEARPQASRPAPDRETLRAVRDPSLGGLSGAHPSLPVPSVVDVSANGRFALVRIERRGGRDGEIALSPRAAETLGIGQGGRVEVRYVGAAPGAGTALAQADEAGPRSLLPPGSRPAEPTTPVAPASPPARAAPTQVWGAPQAYAAAAPTAPAFGGGYMVQIGAFSELSNAHRARAQVLGQGDVIVEPRRVGGTELYRVRLGPWPDRAHAEVARRQVAALGFHDAIIAPR